MIDKRGAVAEAAASGRLADSSRAQIAARAAIVCIASCLGSLLGTWLVFPEIGSAIVFPPYAVVTVALLVSRPRNWPIYLVAASVGCFAPHAAKGSPTSFILMAEVANHTRALVAAIAFRKLTPGARRFASLRSLLWFIFIAVFVAPAVGALIGGAAVSLHGAGDFWLAWRQWALSNALTGVILLPLLWMAVRYFSRRSSFPKDRAWEVAALAIGVLAVSFWVFDTQPSMLARLYLPLPLLLWAAVRFGTGTTSAVLAWMASLAIWGAFHGQGPFVARSPTDNLLELQLFLIALAIPPLLLSGLMEQAGRTAAALRQSREQYRSIVEDQTELICRFLPSGTCTFANRAYCRYLGRAEKDVVGRDLRELDPSVLVRLQASMTPQEAVATRETSTTESPGRFHQWRDRAFFDARGVVVEYQSVGRDVTEEMRAEEERWELDAQKKVARALREESTRKDDFLAMLGHELRNPLAPLILTPERLRSIPTDDPRLGKVADLIARQVSNLSRLVDDLLDVTRIAQGKTDLAVEVLDLAEVVEVAVEEVRPKIDAQDQILTVDVNGPARVMGDAGRLRQVVVNLLTNAARYTHRGGSITLTVRCDGQSALLTVRDNGVGIRPEMLKRVFDVFTQVDGTRDRGRGGGLGLGLALVKRFVELHRGVVEARSAGLGSGAELAVQLPALIEDKSSVVKVPAKPPCPGVTPVRLRILVVDDNAAAADMISSLLGEEHEVHVAYDGAVGLIKAEEVDPDLVLCDLALPRIDGFSVARRLRKRAGLFQPLLVAVTGFGQDDDRRRTLEAGFDHHFIKPLDPMVLFSLVDEVGKKTTRPSDRPPAPAPPRARRRRARGPLESSP